MRLSRAALRAHLLGELLPLWERHGIDRAHGGFWNRLGPDGVPVPDGYKRLVVHARQVYAFSRAAELGAESWSLAAAAQGLEFLEARFWDARHGGWFATTSDDGQPLDRRKDLYGHAFAIFALAEHHRVTREPESLRLARATLALVCERLRDAKSGGFLEAASDDWRPVEEPRRQNPHMHLFEALLALHAVAPAEGAFAEAAALVELLDTRWCEPRSGALGEYFDGGWRPAPGAPGQVVEPGHGFEWFALLARFAELGGGGPREAALAERLFAFAQKYGVDRDGGVFDRVDRAGRPLESGKRLWPQTERIKALAVRLRFAPDPELRAQLEAALEHCARRYVEPSGGWREQLARDGTPLSTAQNATSVYHVVAALCEALRVSD